MAHVPVMLAETLAGLGLAVPTSPEEPRSLAGEHVPFSVPVNLGDSSDSMGWWIDCTVGGGGHTEAILKASAPIGQVLGLDRDRDILDQTRARLSGYGERLRLVHSDYRNLAAVVEAQGLTKIRGILMDLGVSSFQLDQAERGFSFSKSGPLDMRMDRQQAVTAAELVNQADEEELARIFYEYGEEHRSRQLARAVVRRRPFATTHELAQAIRAVSGHGGRIHPATKIFQALRIAVNDELAGLRLGLAAAEKILQPGGRLVVISFHSLEDRIVKQTLRSGPWIILNKHVVRPGELEVGGNPRARSARLRAVQRRDD